MNGDVSAVVSEAMDGAVYRAVDLSTYELSQCEWRRFFAFGMVFLAVLMHTKAHEAVARAERR